MTRRPGLATLVVVVLALGACATVDGQQDVRIEAEVKAALVAETSANLTRVRVVSVDGVVYLSGTVADSEQRSRAEHLARTVAGVRRVVNSLTVQPPA